ncbi:MAG: histidine kinaselike ATPase [Clostridiales bacterium]|jgi:signal transduction histidine kinase|nr:histidine kinaselike ATPase [Clostridiales bacterium]
MENKSTLIFIRYFTILIIAVGMVINRTEVNSEMLILILTYIVNNQLRFFSLDRGYLRVISFVLEIILVIAANRYFGGYSFPYLVLAAIDSNMLFKNPLKIFFNAVIVLMSIYFSINQTLEFKLINIGLTVIIIAVFYFTKDENDKKLQAQELYDELRISQEKLKKANRDLEVYASSIEELTLLRERNRISREIHDSVGHALSTIAIQLGAIERTIGREPNTAEELTKSLRTFTQNSLKDVRMAVREIKPKEFEENEGILVIEELINNFKKLTGVDVRLSFTKERWSLNSDQTYVIYRIVQEFLSNSTRHGKATSVRIVMAFTDYKLVVTLKDNGVGAERIIEGIGFKSIRERVTEIGGTFDYITSLGEGFLVKLEIDKTEKLKIYSKGEGYGEN